MPHSPNKGVRWCLMLCLWCDEQVVFSEVVFVDFKDLSDN